MPEYKLHYFDITGLGEPIRFLMKYGGVEFEDIRYTFEQWPEVKKTMPFGQMPVLEIDGKQYNQSIALCRYFAKQFGLAGDNELEALEIDSVVDTFTDLRIKISAAAWEPNEEVKKANWKKLYDELIPQYLGKLNDIAKDGYLACGKLTWADLFITSLRGYLNWAIKEDFNDFAAFPNLLAIVEKVSEIPSIKKWLEERPKGMF